MRKSFTSPLDPLTQVPRLFIPKRCFLRQQCANITNTVSTKCVETAKSEYSGGMQEFQMPVTHENNPFLIADSDFQAFMELSTQMQLL
jgi:hypothetical protein